MKNYAFVLALLLLALWPLASFGADYAALDGKDFYAGGILLVFNGENASGESAREAFFGACAGGISDGLAWQAFIACSWDDDAGILGGNVDAILGDNFTECGQVCDGEEPALWWWGAGGTLISYRSLFETASGVNVSGEELGLNAGGGYYWQRYAANMYLHFFPDTSNTMISASVMRQF